MMNKTEKNIWVINQFAGTPESGWGERHYFFSKYWLEAGYNVTIITGSYNHMFNKLPNVNHHFTFEEYENRVYCWIKTPRYHPKSILRFWSFMVFALKIIFIPVKKAKKPHIIIVSSMPIFPILPAYWLKKRHKAKKLFFEIRDIWPLSLIELGNYSPKNPAVQFIGWFERFGYKKADRIISLLPNASLHLEKVVPGSSEKFFYIPNGLDDEIITPEPLTDEIESRIPKNKFIVGYAGTIGMANALEYFIEAARILVNNNEIFFVLIGDGYLKDKLKKECTDLNNIVFLPKIKKSQVQAAIAHFHVCFIGRNNSPLYYYGVSANKYFDYMIAGKPILDSNNFIKDPVELAGCGIIVPPESAEAIVEGILYLKSLSGEERQNLGLKGKEHVKKFHNISYLSGKYIELFED